MARAKGTGNSIANARKRAETTAVIDVPALTLYKTAYCRVVIEMGGYGASETEMAVIGCGVVRATMRNWTRIHPEFKQALEFAKDASQAWWEQTGRTRLRTVGFNTNLYNKIISCRFRADYSERVVHAGDPDQPLFTKIERRFVKAKD